MTDNKHDRRRPEPYLLDTAPRRGRRSRRNAPAESDSSPDSRSVRVRPSPSPSSRYGRDGKCCRSCYKVTCQYLCYTSYILAAVVCVIVIWGTASGSLRVTVTMGV